MSSAAIETNTHGWLRSFSFDFVYIIGIALVALTAGAVVIIEPEYFPLVLFMDLWLLGYHHVISTFTRLAFDTDSFRQHRFLVLGLPFLVVVGVVAACMLLGTWILVTTYLYWQWFHYTRQSYGISKIYRRKAGLSAATDDRLTHVLVYIVPIAGILHRSYQHPSEFLMMEVKMLPVPYWAVAAASALAVVTLVWWAARQLMAWRGGQLMVAHTLYVMSHIVIFSAGYLFISDINHGWLVVNIWHNAQYILLVWMFNNNRFSAGVDARHRFLSTISQNKYRTVYFLVCLGISTAIYAAISFSLEQARLFVAFAAALPLVVVAYQVINFHHYIVDSVIWKVRKKSLKQNLGIAG